MIESLLKTELVSRLRSGEHENLHCHFDEFADEVTLVCARQEDWSVNNAELIKLESTLEIYHVAFTVKSGEPCHIIKVVVKFLRNIRDYFTMLYSKAIGTYRPAVGPMNTEVGDTECRQKDNEIADIAVIDTVEFIHGCAFKLFPRLNKSRVREKVNEFLGTTITDRQMHNNYANLKRRRDDDHAMFFRRWHSDFNQELINRAATDDERRKHNS